MLAVSLCPAQTTGGLSNLWMIVLAASCQAKSDFEERKEKAGWRGCVWKQGGLESSIHRR